MQLPEEQARLLQHLAAGAEGQRVAEIADTLDVDQARIAAASVLLKEQGLVEILETPFRELHILPEGRRWAREGFPERRILAACREAGGSLAMADAPGRTGLLPKEVGGSLKWFQARGWGRKDGSVLIPTAPTADPVLEPDERLLIELDRREKASEEELAAAGIDTGAAIELLKGRGGWCEVREKAHRRLRLTQSGRDAVAGGLTPLVEVTQLTPELIASGKWREVTIRSYDVQLATEPVHPGKRHPLQRILEQVRHAYLAMGFQEITSPLVETAFWDFDALFQPQDHPAREMQDTFYLAEPGSASLPTDSALVDRVRRVHENGGDTGSIGWQYSWSEEKARRTVLRTHTTATTIRALAADPTTPRRVFSVGRVFRREAIDYKHLPIFFQVDGIVIDPDASFANLLGTLRAFYERMGFDQFKFRPDFFPYTEPSVNVDIWFDRKKDWFEMGGAGVFRPEVTEPLGCRLPVLAWGLGLDRLAMLRYDMSDIRDLYIPDTEWLKGVPLCR